MRRSAAFKSTPLYLSTGLKLSFSPPPQKDDPATTNTSPIRQARSVPRAPDHQPVGYDNGMTGQNGSLTTSRRPPAVPTSSHLSTN